MAASKAIGFLNFKFGADLSGFERAMKKAQKKLKKFGKNIENTGRNMTMGLTLPIIGLGAAALKFGSDLEETDSKFKQVFISIQKEAEDTAKVFQESFGLSELAAKQLLSDTGDLLVGFGFTEKAALELSKQVNELAVDLASFTNFEGGSEGASKALTKALVGETESAKSLGIVIRQNTTEYKERTAAIMRDKGVSILQAKAINNLEIATSQSQKAIGDFSRTSGDFANQMRILQGDLVDVASEMGARLIPYAQAAIEKFKLLIKWFDGLSDSQKDNIVKWGLILAAIGPVLIIIGKLAIGISALIPLLTSIGFLNPFTLMIAGAIAAVAAITKVVSVLTDQFNLQKQIDSVNEQARKNIADDLIKIKVSTRLLTDENTSLSFKKKLLDDLKKTYPGYYDQLDEATLSTKNLKQSNDNLINSLLKFSQIDALKGRLTEIQREILDANKSIGTSFTEDWGLTSGFSPLDILLKHLSITEGFEDVSELKTEAEALTKILTGLLVETADTNEEFEKLDHTTTNLSLSLDPLVEETKMYSDALETVSTDMLFMASSAEDQFKGILTWTQTLTKAQEAHNATVVLLEDIMFSAAMSAANSQQKFFDSFIENIKQAIKQLLIQLAVLTVIALLLGGPTMTIGKAFGIAKGKILGLEDGGLVYGPTTALIGEGVGTTASNPEVVAPLDKLKQHMGGGNQNIIVEGVLKGNDIYLSNKNTSVNRLRTT